MHRSLSRFSLFTVGALIAGVLAGAAPAYAQTHTTSGASSTNSSTSNGQTIWAISGAIGLGLPTSSGLDVGPDLQAAVEGWFPELNPIGLRLEVGWDHFGYGNSASYVYDGYNYGYSGSLSTLRFVLDAVYDFPMHHSHKVQPYVVGGLGLYHSTASISYNGSYDCPECNFSGSAGTGTNLGFNIGGGVRIPLGGMQGFAELRYQDPFGSSGSAFFPLQVGIRYILK